MTILAVGIYFSFHNWSCNLSNSIINVNVNINIYLHIIKDQRFCKVYIGSNIVLRFHTFLKVMWLP